MIGSDSMDRLVDQHKLVDQQLAVTTVLFVNNYMITCHNLICQLLEVYDHTIIKTSYSPVWLLVQGQNFM